MLTGMVIWRDFSTGSAGIRPRMSNGPNIPLVVQYNFCANAPVDAAVQSRLTRAATMPDFFMVLIRPWNFLVVVLLLLVPTCTAENFFLNLPDFGREFLNSFPAIAFRYLR